MYSINPSYYELGNCSNSLNFLQGVLLSSSTATTNIGNSSSRSTTAEEKAAAASKSHSEAERRRRKRINGHLATLRTLLPNNIKTDKASLLAEVVRRLRELKKTTAELAATENSQSNLFPSETDELKLCYSDGGDSESSSGSITLIKAILCCEDRPELISEVTRAVRAVSGKVVRAEIATVGGRIKTILWVQVYSNTNSDDGGGGDSSEEEGLGKLRRVLKAVVDRTGLSGGSGCQALPENKRPRLCLSQY